MAYSAQDAAYLQSKLTELQGKGKTEYQNIDQVYGAFQMAGLTPQQHAEKYGVNEGLTYPTGNVAMPLPNPNVNSNPTYSYTPSEQAYYEQKLQQLQNTGKTQYQNIDQVAGAFQYSGLTPQQHYQQYGKNEGLNWNGAAQYQQPPEWLGQWKAMQDQYTQMMDSWKTMQQPQQQTPFGYTGSNTNYNYQPVYSNPLMRPVTANANIAPQQAPSNMGYQNRTSLWSDV